MRFYRTHKIAAGNAGSYLLAICGIIVSFFLGSVLSTALASLIGVDLLNPGQDVNSNLILALQLLPFSFPVLSILLSVRYLHKLPMRSALTAREKFDWSRFKLMFFIWLTVNFGMLGMAYLMGDEFRWNFNPEVFFTLLFIAFIFLAIQTLAEELVFRSYLFQALGRMNVQPIFSVVFLALIFGYMHAGNSEVGQFGQLLLVFYILNGLFLGLITALDNGIELSYGFHFANNLSAVLLVTLESSSLKSEALFLAEESDMSVLPTLVITFATLLLLFFLLKRKYNWQLGDLLKKD